MAVSYFNSRSLNLNAQRSYGPAISNSGSVLNKCPSCNGILFGMKVQQTAPNRYLNTSNPCGESFHNPFSDCRFPKVLVRVLYRREPEKSKPLKTGIDGLPSISKEFRELSQPRAVSFETDAGQKRHFSSINSIGSDGERPLKRLRHGEDALMSTLRSKPSGLLNKAKAQQNDENILYTSQSELRVDHVWSMGITANSQAQSINANHSPLDPTFKNIAGSVFSGMGRSTPKISSVVANNLHQSEHIRDQDQIETFSKPKAPIAIITPQLNSEQLQQNTSAKNKFNASASISGESLTNCPDQASQKAYEESEKRKAYQKAYRQSERGKARRKAYRKSAKGIASRKAYEQTDKRKASLRAYRQSDKCKAYQKAYEQTEKRKASRRAYRKSEKGKASRKAYEQSDKGKAARRAYRKSDTMKGSL